MTASGMPLVLKSALCITVLIGGVYDLRIRKIPNWLNLAGVAAGLSLNTLLFAGWGTVTAALGLALAIAVYLPLYLLKGMGAGDVKLMAAVGAIAGPRNWLSIFLVTALLGGCISLVLVLWKKRFQQTFINVATILQEVFHGRAPAHKDSLLDIRNNSALRLPHGSVIACGVFLCLFFGLES